VKTLFLSPPSFDGFDGGAGARYQAKREVTSFWYPTWLAQPAALVPGSTLVDAAPAGLSTEDVLKIAVGHDLVIMHTSTPSLPNDVECARRIKEQNPNVKVGFIGAHVAVLPELTLETNPVIDFVCRNNFDYTCKELSESRPWDSILGLSYRDADGVLHKNAERPDIADWDAMPSVLPIYDKFLDIRKYYNGYLLHPYVSWYTGRGCVAKCSFCLWPHTIGGHKFVHKTAEAVGRDIDEAVGIFGNRVAEYMFDDDTLTGEKEYAIALSKHMKRHNLSWACNARAHVDYDTLKTLRDNGLRVLLVGFESGNQEILHRIRKGLNLGMAREFMKNCHKLGIKVHGTFIIGLPVETPETVRETIEFAKELDPHTIQVSIASPYPGTALYDQALANGWFARQDLVSGSNGIQTSTLSYETLSTAEIEDSVERMYREFYFRPKKIAKIVGEMVTSRQMMVRRLREGGEFFGYLKNRHISTAKRRGENEAALTTA
jgi:hopanoid biosynthesis associated radical SAM protein HpnJ